MIYPSLVILLRAVQKAARPTFNYAYTGAAVLSAGSSLFEALGRGGRSPDEI
jgi:hypothetical protein